MRPGRPRGGGSPATKTRLREPDGAAGGDFAWPPPADDPAGCSIVALEADVVPRPRARTTIPADAPMEWFPDIDVETALDAFADAPARPRGGTSAELGLPRALPVLPASAPRWRIAGIRGGVALCIAASLALLPPPGEPPLEALEAAPPRPAVRALDATVGTRPPAAAPRRLGAPADTRLAPAPVAEPRPGRAAPRDEDRVRATLAELGAAYSQLDAVAAREVWPSVDVDALARTFEDLKSQELRFDHCDVAVHGERARADCTGQAIYVPRAGDPIFSSAARAWTFELTRLRGRWTIASGRAS